MRVKWLKCFAKEHGNLHNLNYNLHLEVLFAKEGGGEEIRKTLKLNTTIFLCFR